MEVQEVLNQLKKYLGPEESWDQFLNRSVIAGGAICNIIYNNKYSEAAPVNDIDIFLFQKTENKSKFNLDGAIDTYAEDFDLNSNRFKMLGTERFGIINVTTIAVDRIDSLVNLGMKLVDNFDINCTKGFITLENDPKLILHEEFNEFLKTKQIKSLKNKTPIKTMLRILKKKRELNAYVNNYHLKSIYQLSRGKKTSIIEETFLKYPLELVELSSYFRFFKMSTGLYQAKYLRPYEDLHRNEVLAMKNMNLREKMITIFDLKFSKNKFYDKYLKLRSYRKSFKTFLMTDLHVSLKMDFNENDLVYLEKVLNKVIETAKFFNQLSLVNAMSVAKTLIRLSEAEDENIYTAFLGLLRFENAKVNVREEFFKFKKSYIESDQPLIIAYVLDNKFKGIVKELVSKSALMNEGKMMSHCVGGYYNSLQKNSCRIFSITTSVAKSTFEVRYLNNTFVGVQHRAFANSFPHDLNRSVAISLLEYLNKNIQPNQGLSFPTEEIIHIPAALEF
jgi:hypothetical protein